MGTKRGRIVISARRPGGRRRTSTKVIGGRGRPRNPWVEWLYPRLLEEFDRLRKLGVKLEPPLLLQLAKEILSDNTDGYYARSVDDKGALIINKITSRWVQTFMEAHQIVLRTQSGKKQLSAAKILHIEKSVAFHLGELRRGFADGSLDEDAIANIDETHFVVDFDNGKTLGFSGEKHIKYADVVSGGEGLTMVVRLSGGASAQIFPPMMIFMNAEGNYPIRGVKDNVPGLTPVDARRLFSGQLLRAFRCRDELDAINADFKFLPPHATDPCQPADSFVIAQIKDAWKMKWNEKKMALINDNCWQNNVRKDGSWSGKLRNPGKSFFLELAAETVRTVN
ncbi:hypothetical protein PHMEG_00033478 [Phytophthora megakarya]|uniref:DDE-1 domain-containing protein n=1 Tax=Phytophthora megakarya TaxID=4795 RepID=A0A225UT89_9STRA|nr:hypothetical protein PHMEG_00033478 [Phytophthora megakarya]